MYVFPYENIYWLLAKSAVSITVRQHTRAELKRERLVLRRQRDHAGQTLVFPQIYVNAQRRNAPFSNSIRPTAYLQN